MGCANCVWWFQTLVYNLSESASRHRSPALIETTKTRPCGGSNRFQNSTRAIQVNHESWRRRHRRSSRRLRKTRPAIIVRTDAFPETHSSVVICQMTSEVVDAPDFRVTIDPSAENGLQVRSQVMADKPVTVRRRRIGQIIGRLSERDIGRLNIALAFVMGLAD